MLGHKRVWLNSLGLEWRNEVILGSTRRYATELYQPLTIGNNLFASAYGPCSARRSSFLMATVASPSTTC